MTRALLPLLIVLGCNGTPDDEEPRPDTLTCDVLASPEFCYTVGVGEAYDCMTTVEGSGTFSSDRTSCAYADGTKIVFDEAVPADVFGDDDYLWAFTIEDPSGAACFSFEETLRGTEMSSSSGTVEQDLSGFSGLDITCPDGEVLHIGNAFDLFDCEDDAVIPGFSSSGSGDSLSFSLLGAPEGEFSLWRCEAPS